MADDLDDSTLPHAAYFPKLTRLICSASKPKFTIAGLEKFKQNVVLFHQALTITQPLVSSSPALSPRPQPLQQSLSSSSNGEVGVGMGASAFPPFPSFSRESLAGPITMHAQPQPWIAGPEPLPETFQPEPGHVAPSAAPASAVPFDSGLQPLRTQFGPPPGSFPMAELSQATLPAPSAAAFEAETQQPFLAFPQTAGPFAAAAASSSSSSSLPLPATAALVLPSSPVRVPLSVPPPITPLTAATAAGQAPLIARTLSSQFASAPASGLSIQNMMLLPLLGAAQSHFNVITANMEALRSLLQTTQYQVR